MVNYNPMKKYLLIIALILNSCMGNFTDLNPLRKRVDESLSGTLGSKSDIVIGSSTFSFVVCGDIHTSSGEVGILTSILEETSGGSDQFIVLLGDLVDWGKEDQYATLNSQLSRYTYPHGKYQVIGNHDVFFDGWDSYKKYFGPSVYSFSSETAKFIVLDSANATLGLQQLDWLENELSSTTKDHIFVFTHVGIYTGGLSSVFKLSSQDESYRLHYLLKKYGVSHVLAGHYHAEKQFEIDGIQYIISGGSSSGMLDSGPNHYKRITVSPTGVTVSVHPI
jgi:predicted phosphodiesterase